MLKTQLTATLVGDGSTQDTASVLEHEVYLLRGNEFCGSDEVSLVFTVFVVNDNDELSFLEVFKGLLY